MQVFLTKNNAEMKINVCECKELIYKVLIKCIDEVEIIEIEIILHCIAFNTFYTQHRNCYLFCFLQTHEL